VFKLLEKTVSECRILAAKCHIVVNDSRVVKHQIIIPHWVFHFAETFRSFVRNGLKISVIFLFSEIFYDRRKQ